MALVPAKCTSCGAQLTVDDKKEAAVCEYCNTPYIVEKAINNFLITGINTFTIDSATINVQGMPSVENLLIRASEFEINGNIDLALSYYNRVLDLDYSNIHARKAIERLDNKVILEIPVTGGFIHGKLTLYKDKLIYTTRKKENIYPVNSISSVNRFVARLTIKFSSPKSVLDLAIGSPADAKLMEEAICSILNRR